MNKGLEIRAVRDRFRGGDIAIFIEQFTSTQAFSVKNIELALRSPDELYAVDSPPITISNAMAQQLMDDLWSCGLRPSEGTGSAGQLAATQRHLEDMRQLVFKQLRTKKPEGK